MKLEKKLEIVKVELNKRAIAFQSNTGALVLERVQMYEDDLETEKEVIAFVVGFLSASFKFVELEV